MLGFVGFLSYRDAERQILFEFSMHRASPAISLAGRVPVTLFAWPKVDAASPFSRLGVVGKRTSQAQAPLSFA